MKLVFLKEKDFCCQKARYSENLKRYMWVVMEEFLDKYYHSYVIGFKGDLSPFHDFERVIDHYFDI